MEAKGTDFIGKITIIKQLAVPKVLFSASVLPIPDGVVKRLLYSITFCGENCQKKCNDQ